MKNTELRGTCQICGKTHKLDARGRLVRHGWKMQTHSDWGRFQIQSECEGSHHLPIQQDREALIKHVADVTEWASTQQQDNDLLIKYVADQMRIVATWEPCELIEVIVEQNTQEPAQTQKHAQTQEPAQTQKHAQDTTEADKAEKQYAVSKLIHESLNDCFLFDDVTMQHETATMHTLKSGSVKLKAQVKMNIGDTVKVKAEDVAVHHILDNPRSFILAQVLKTNKRGEATAWVYTSPAFDLSGIDYETTKQTSAYVGYNIGLEW